MSRQDMDIMRVEMKRIDCMQFWLDRMLVILDGNYCSVCIEVKYSLGLRYDNYQELLPGIRKPTGRVVLQNVNVNAEPKYTVIPDYTSKNQPKPENL